MTWFLAMVIVALIGGVVVVATGVGQGLPPDEVDVVADGLPAEGPLCAEDLRTVRFRMSAGGYRPAEVDALLRRVADQLPHRSD